MIRVWNANKPSYIDNKEFKLWLDKMLKICDDEIVLPISISEFIDYINNSNITLNIKFSPEIIKKMNGIYSLDEVKKYIKNNFLINEKVLNILDDYHTENNLKHSLNDLSGILAQLNKCSKEKIKSLLNKYIQNNTFEMCMSLAMYLYHLSEDKGEYISPSLSVSDNFKFAQEYISNHVIDLTNENTHLKTEILNMEQDSGYQFGARPY